jgi:hypothetical protein
VIFLWYNILIKLNKELKMAKVKSLMMDLQEEFYAKAATLVIDSDSVWEAQQRVEKLRKVEYNWLDQFQVAEDVENFYYA